MSDRESAESAAAAFIASRSAGWTQAQADEFARWLESSVGNRVAYYRLNAAWQEAGRLQSLGSEHVLPEATRRETSARLRPRRAMAALAAGLALAVTAGWALQWRQDMKGETYSTAVGGLEVIRLAEGSQVTLNSDSKVRVQLRDRERGVTLERGEAFFEVAKDPQRPFVVEVTGRRVIAIGTAFSVRAEGREVSLLVSDGKVLMTGPDDAGVLGQPLGAGSLVRSTPTGARVEMRSDAEIEQSLSWRTGRLVFRDTPLAEATAQFNRYNARKIVVEDAAAARIRVGGVFRTTDVDAFLRLIEAGFPVRVVAEPERVVIRLQ